MTIPLDLLIAFVAITVPDHGSDAIPCPLHTLQVVAVQLELMDPRECQYCFALETYRTSDLADIRNRYAELGDAPRLSDSIRFPSLEACRDARRLNWEYVSWLEERRRLFPNDEWIGEAIAESQELYSVWDWAEDCRRELYYTYWRRRCLQKLRNALSPHAYYAGYMPPSVPIWRFWRADG